MTRFIGTLVFLVFSLGVLRAESHTPYKALARMPVKEVTVFKDGHAFMLHSGRMPVDDKGNVVMDYLPNPVIGTFWPFSSDSRAALSSVTASRRTVLVDRTALQLRELIEANIGAEVLVTETGTPAPTPYRATIIDVPAQSSDELEAADEPYSGEKLTRKSDIVLLKTSGGVKAVHMDHIQDVSFTGSYKKVLPREELRNLLTLQLDWAGGTVQKEANVGLLYLQRGIRWIPQYKVVIDGKGQALVTLQATLINEIADLQDVTAHLVIGVPNFVFKSTNDPISLQQAVAQLSSHFRQESETGYGFSNALMTQQAMPMDDMRRRDGDGGRGPVDLGPEVAESGKNEDLYVFTIKHVTLGKGQRMVFPIGEFTLKYKDVYTLDIPFAPPMEVWRNLDGGRQGELASLLNAPKVRHKIRLFNTSEYPLTTAPALILRDSRLLAQGLMTYAAAGDNTDLEITMALDIRVKKSDNETRRVPNASTFQGDQYGRVDLAGSITLTSYRDDAVEVEVTRHVLGNVESAGNKGRIEMVNVFEDVSYSSGRGPMPAWWGWFSWPWWWHHFNGVGRITWTVSLTPQKPMELGYTWNYFWR
ncbi:MAG: hypothetical protein HY962_14795 [Ignavibacteriae bacterium]|nr:hypothetical protein [Ignavibacteriota bacterium]